MYLFHTTFVLLRKNTNAKRKHFHSNRSVIWLIQMWKWKVSPPVTLTFSKKSIVIMRMHNVLWNNACCDTTLHQENTCWGDDYVTLELGFYLHHWGATILSSSGLDSDQSTNWPWTCLTKRVKSPRDSWDAQNRSQSSKSRRMEPRWRRKSGQAHLLEDERLKHDGLRLQPTKYSLF